MAKVQSSKIITLVLLAYCWVAVSGCARQQVQRYGSVIGIKQENIAEYKRLHADTWPGVLKRIKRCNIRNYSIYLGEVAPEQFYLFSYFEYKGKDFEKDMARMAKDKTTQQWWRHTDPLQVPLPTRKGGEWWANWEEVFHFEGPPVDKEPQRFGSVIALKSEREGIIAYKQLHAAVWPGVLEAIEKANIRNYSIYLGRVQPDRYYLFSYFEYYGDDYEADMAKIAENEITKVWWTYTDPLQEPVPTRQEGEWWATMEEVFHAD
jgi:L-rhamnose mutarotase